MKKIMIILAALVVAPLFAGDKRDVVEKDMGKKHVVAKYYSTNNGTVGEVSVRVDVERPAEQDREILGDMADGGEIVILGKAAEDLYRGMVPFGIVPESQLPELIEKKDVFCLKGNKKEGTPYGCTITFSSR